MEEYRKILVPIDGSDRLMKALDNAISLAKAFSSKVIIVHIMEPSGSIISGMSDISMGFPDEELLIKQKRAIGSMMKDHKAFAFKAGIEIESMVLEGNPAHEIITLSKTNDLIIMGTHGKTRWKRDTLGSIASGVSQNVHCPVLLVR